MLRFVGGGGEAYWIGLKNDCDMSKPSGPKAEDEDVLCIFVMCFYGMLDVIGFIYNVAKYLEGNETTPLWLCFLRRMHYINLTKQLHT